MSRLRWLRPLALKDENIPRWATQPDNSNAKSGSSSSAESLSSNLVVSPYERLQVVDPVKIYLAAAAIERNKHSMANDERTIVTLLRLLSSPQLSATERAKNEDLLNYYKRDLHLLTGDLTFLSEHPPTRL
jgi:hypothetical protein